MRKLENRKPGANRPGSPTSLTDEDITTVSVDRRSFFSRCRRGRFYRGGCRSDRGLPQRDRLRRRG